MTEAVDLGAASAVALPGRVVYHTDLDAPRAASRSHEPTPMPATLFIDGKGNVSKQLRPRTIAALRFFLDSRGQ